MSFRNRQFQLKFKCDLIAHLSWILDGKVCFIEYLDNLPRWVSQPRYTIATPADNVFFVSTSLFRQQTTMQILIASRTLIKFLVGYVVFEPADTGWLTLLRKEVHLIGGLWTVFILFDIVAFLLHNKIKSMHDQLSVVFSIKFGSLLNFYSNFLNHLSRKSWGTTM